MSVLNRNEDLSFRPNLLLEYNLLTAIKLICMHSIFFLFLLYQQTKLKIMNACNYCEMGVSDYNGRIVCKEKYIYPSFQDYSYNMFNNSELSKRKVLIEFNELEKFSRQFYFVLLMIFGYVIYLIF